jgi:hypothetical protein
VEQAFDVNGYFHHLATDFHGVHAIGANKDEPTSGCM